MTRLLQTESFDHPISVAELRGRVSELNLSQCLQVVTRFSSRYLWFPNSPEITRRVNTVNLSLLAKAIVLWADPNGRPLNIDGDLNDDLRWLFTAINSLQWYSEPEIRTNTGETVISFLIRQAFVRHSTADHSVPTIARSFALFHEIIATDNPTAIDIHYSMVDAFGLTTTDLWVLCAAVYFFYCPHNGSKTLAFRRNLQVLRCVATI